MCIQGTWADALIIQAVADALKVTIQIVEGVLKIISENVNMRKFS